MDDVKTRREAWVTASDVWAFAVCPWIVFHRKVMGNYSTVTTYEMIAGSFEHEVRRRIVNGLAMHRQTASSVIEQSIQEAFSYAKINYEGFPHSIGQIRSSLLERLTREIDDIVRMTPDETEVSLVSARIRLLGRVDCLFRIHGKYVPCDYKTRYKESHHKANILQVTAYAILVEENRGPVEQGMVHYTSLGKRVFFPITEDLKTEVYDIIKRIRLMIEGKWLPEQEPLTLNQCWSCPYRSLCEQHVSCTNRRR